MLAGDGIQEENTMTTTAAEVVRFWRLAGMRAWFNGGEART